jgi:hypothetical protein
MWFLLLLSIFSPAWSLRSTISSLADVSASAQSKGTATVTLILDDNKDSLRPLLDPLEADLSPPGDAKGIYSAPYPLLYSSAEASRENKVYESFALPRGSGIVLIRGAGAGAGTVPEGEEETEDWSILPPVSIRPGAQKIYRGSPLARPLARVIRRWGSAQVVQRIVDEQFSEISAESTRVMLLLLWDAEAFAAADEETQRTWRTAASGFVSLATNFLEYCEVAWSSDPALFARIGERASTVSEGPVVVALSRFSPGIPAFTELPKNISSEDDTFALHLHFYLNAHAPGDVAMWTEETTKALVHRVRHGVLLLVEPTAQPNPKSPGFRTLLQIGREQRREMGSSEKLNVQPAWATSRRPDAGAPDTSLDIVRLMVGEAALASGTPILAFISPGDSKVAVAPADVDLSSELAVRTWFQACMARDSSRCSMTLPGPAPIVALALALESLVDGVQWLTGGERKARLRLALLCVVVAFGCFVVLARSMRSKKKGKAKKE